MEVNEIRGTGSDTGPNRNTLIATAEQHNQNNVLVPVSEPVSAAVAITAADARALTDRIKVALDATWMLVQDAWTARAWAALGYGSWDDYCTQEFGTSRLRLPREERPEVMSSMRELGMSVRAIASATGVSKDTVHRTLTAGVANETAEPEVLNAEIVLDGHEQLIAELSDDQFEEVIQEARTGGDMSQDNVGRLVVCP